ncbi:MAG: FlgD immunoglobulin-like domain containing protein [bacterium]
MGLKKTYFSLLIILFWGTITFVFAQFPEYSTNPFQFTIPDTVHGQSFFTVDLNADGLLDYTFRSKTTLYAYDHYGNSMWSVPLAYPGIGINNHGTKHGAADIDADGSVEIVAIDTSKIYIFNGNSGVLKNTISVTIRETQILGHIVVVNLQGNGDHDAIVQTIDKHPEGDQRYYINRTLIAYDLKNRQELWRLEQDDNIRTAVHPFFSATYEGYFGCAHNAPLCADIDLDGRDEVIGATVVDENGNVIDPGYFDIWRKWIDAASGVYIDHIDAISIGDFRKKRPGLEWVLIQEDHLHNAQLQNEWHTVMFSGDNILWRRETGLFRNSPRREPQNIAAGNFDPEKTDVEIWNRSRFNYDDSHRRGTGQHPWVYDTFGNLFAHYGTETTLPEGFNSEQYGGNANGLEMIWTIDWSGDGKDYIAAQSRHDTRNAGIFDAVTGDSIWTTLSRDASIQSDFIYVADVAGDSREELISCDISSNNPVIKIFYNNNPNQYPEVSKWEDPLYKRLKQNWNYYSPGSYTSYPKYKIIITSEPEGFEIIVDGESYTTPHTFEWFKESEHQVLMPTPQNELNGERFVFNSWSNEENRSHTYTVDLPDTLTGYLNEQYYLDINSNHGNPQGENWYDKNTSAEFSVITPITQGKTKYIFQNWSGDLYSTEPSGSIVMDSPKTINANWLVQFYLNVISSHGNPQGEGWYNKQSTASFSLTSPEQTDSIKYIFQNWTGDYTGTSTSGSIIMDTTKTVTAIWLTQYYLFTDIEPASGGTITPPPPGEWINADSNTTVSATANSGYEFIWWTGDISGNDNPFITSMTKPKTVQANFGKKVQITINTEPQGLDFYADNTLYTAPHTFTWTEKLRHELKPKSPQSSSQGSRYVFSSWSDEAQEIRNYTVPETNDELTINFTKQHYLSIDTPHGEPQGEGWYNENQDASFSVNTPDVNNTTRYQFISWGGDYSGTDPSGSVTMDRPKTITASWNTQYYLHISSLHGNPHGQGWYDTGTEASFSLTSPIQDELTKYIFDHWSGDCADTTTSGSILMDDAKTIIAHWVTQHYLSLSEQPVTGGDITPSPPGGWYTEQSSVELNASAASGYKFTTWSGDLSSQNSSEKVTIAAPMSITANFKKKIQITIYTDPPGLNFTADGYSYTAPHTFTWLEDSEHPLDSDSIQSYSKTARYRFNTWNNQAEKNQLYTVPGSDSALTAQFFTQYFLDVNSSYGNPRGEGWYNQDSTAVFSVNEYYYESNEIRFVFLNWSGDIQGITSPKDSLIMDSPKTVTANWQPQYYLTIENNGHGKTQGEGWYNDGDETNFSITPTLITMQGDSQFVFTGWSGKGIGSYSGEKDSHTITINNPVTETANWELQYKITTSTIPAWAGSIQLDTGDEWVKKGEQVIVTAIPASDTEYEFSYWSGDLSGNINPKNMVVDHPKKICAHFIIQGLYTITTEPDSIPITVDNVTYISPHQFNWISGSSHTISTPESYHKNDNIKYHYDHWDNKGDREQEIIIAEKKTYKAYFITQYYLSTSVDPPQGGDIIPAPPGTWCEEDTYVTIRIEPAEYFNFLYWNGDLTGGSNPDSIRMISPKKITAVMEELVTGINTDLADIPKSFSLHQNTPNPFNPETMIKFEIPKTSPVDLSIYNSSGQHIRTLVNDMRSRGTYNIMWDGTNKLGESVSSGIYFYILKAGSVLKMRKCILLR